MYNEDHFITFLLIYLLGSNLFPKNYKISKTEFWKNHNENNNEWVFRYNKNYSRFESY